MAKWIPYRPEMRRLFQGDESSVGQAYWAVLRMSRIGEYSEYWHEQTKEAVGGPKWKFDDMFVKVISSPSITSSNRTSIGDNSGTDMVARIGIDNMESQVFGIEYESIMNNPRWTSIHHRRLPTQEEDIIFTIDRCVGKRPPRGRVRPIDRFKIVNPEYIRGDDGQVELILLFTKRFHGEQ